MTAMAQSKLTLVTWFAAAVNGYYLGGLDSNECKSLGLFRAIHTHLADEHAHELRILLRSIAWHGQHYATYDRVSLIERKQCLQYKLECGSLESTSS
eukprot:SAG31_NODE_444_length_15625_cov_6.047469_10_plen_97_part_00